MATKSDFSQEEWKQILQGVMMSAMAITAADPSGLWGTLKEGFASAGVLAKVKTDDNSNKLIQAIVDDFGTSEGRSIAKDGLSEKFKSKAPDQIQSLAMRDLQDVVAILQRQAPEDAQAVKDWFMIISQSVAEASKEGGFLGFGGERVSEAEQSTLDEISKVLNS